MVIMNAASVTQFLKTKDIKLSPNNSWLLGCIDWYGSHNDLAQTYGSLQDYVYVQWALADLRDIKEGGLPTNCKNGNTILTGKHAVQVNWLRDIGQSSYNQLKSIQNTIDNNVSVSADENKKESWEPRPKRCFLMEITDGITTIKATEYSPISKIGESLSPGCKVILIGPIECRSGILLLQNNNINLLGGEVDDLYDINSKENILCRSLNLPVNAVNTNDPIAINCPSENVSPNILQENYTNGPVTSSYSPTNIVNNRLDQFDDAEELPDSTTLEFEHNEHNNSIMSGDDDIFLQVPDDVFHGSNVAPPYPDLLPDFGRTSNIRDKQISSSQESTEGQSNIVLPVQPSKMKQARLFPSLEDLRPVEQESNSGNIGASSSLTTLKDFPSKIHCLATTSRNSCSKNIGLISTKHSIDLESEKIKTIGESIATTMNETLRNDSYSKNVHVNKIIEQSGTQSDKNNVLANDIESKEELSLVVNEKYPLTKLSEIIQVKSITKLKIKNKEWLCTAVVLIENQSVSVSFSDKLLEQLIGMSASELEMLRGEMSTNPSLKKKVNDIVRDGQKKLKSLRGLATMEYSSEDCEPLIVFINDAI